MGVLSPLPSATDSPVKTGLVFLSVLLVAYATRVVYRLYLHPLRAFPGPRKAAISSSWLYELSKSGKVEEELERLHKKYNTNALRIAPNELHLTDVSLYKTIYSQSRPYLKDKAFYDGFGTPHTVFIETDSDLHKERRRRLNPFFARSGLFKIEPMLHTHVGNLVDRLTTLSKQGKSIVAHNAFRCVTVDIITEFAFAKSRLLVKSSADDFSNDFLLKFEAGAEVLWDSVYNPTIRQVGMMIPKDVTAKFNRPMKLLFELFDDAATSLHSYKTQQGTSKSPVIFDGLSDLPEEQIAAEAVDILVAGSDTTAFTLTTGVFRIVHDSAVKQKLMEALKEAFPNPSEKFPSLLELEAVPYLMACMKESLRVAMPVPGRLPRIVPDSTSPLLAIDGKAVEPGTIVGISAYTMHFSEELWGSDARSFNPDRWLGEKGKALDGNLVTFSKGARSCIGQNLAQAELLLMFYGLFRNFDVELDSSTPGELITKDVFTQLVLEPGLCLKMSRLG